MRILVANPALTRFDVLGACEQDRLANVRDLLRLGHEVLLFTQSYRYKPLDEHRAYYAAHGLPARVAPYRNEQRSWRRLGDPAYLDGAAWEYAAPSFSGPLRDALREWKPDLVWCHASYLWPAARLAFRAGYRIVLRSVNYESAHQRQESTPSLANGLRVMGKELGERRALAFSHVLAAITPDEAAIYRQVKPDARVKTLPLRTLPALLRPPRPAAERSPLHVYFMGATYNVPHNRSALEFVVGEVLPRVRAQAPGRFVFHVLGTKIPAHIQSRAAADLVLDGFAPDLETFLAGMDIALVPSMFGQGMQQKVFESLCRAFPTITHGRALAGYPFQPGEDVLVGQDADSFAAALLSLEAPARRQALSAGASARAAQLFNQGAIDAVVNEILAEARG
ncbi:MAG: glycosyltransferase [Anaerolineae bacterium]|nr:glycosyltransferase [Anaerolineae bacterium]